MTQRLSGQVAMVTGASSGLGAHFARLLASPAMNRSVQTKAAGQNEWTLRCR